MRASRWIALVAMAAVVVATLAIQPALSDKSGGIRELLHELYFTKKETRLKFTPRKVAKNHYKKFARKTNVYTKSDVYSKGEADQKFLPTGATTQLSVHPGTWEPVVTSGEVGAVNNFPGDTDLLSGGAAPLPLSLLFHAPLTIPATLQGKPVQVVSFELCYDATFGGATLDRVLLIRNTQTSSAPGIVAEALVEDGTDRDDEACRTYTLAPATIHPDQTLSVDAEVRFSTSSSISVGRLTVNLSI